MLIHFLRLILEMMAIVGMASVFVLDLGSKDKNEALNVLWLVVICLLLLLCFS